MNRFGRHTEIFTEPCLIPFGATLDQFGSDGGRGVDLVGQHARFFGGDDFVDRLVHAAAMHRNENTVVPRFLDAGKGVLHAGYIGEYLDPFFGEVAQQEARNSEKSRITRGEQDHALIGVFEKIDQFGKITQLSFFTDKIRERLPDAADDRS